MKPRLLESCRALCADSKSVATPGWFRRGLFALVVALVSPAAHANPGDLDTSFGTGGTALFTAAPGASLAVALRPGGAGYVLAGSAIDAGGVSRFELTALLANGGADTAFGGTGRILLDQKGIAHAVAFDPSGRILLAGESDAGVATIVRVLSDGTPDATFGTGGSLEVDPTFQGASRVRAVAVQSDGKILHAGLATSGGKGFAYVARLKEDGSLDGTFANGSSYITLGSGSEFRGLVLQPDGKIVAAGYTTIAADKGFFAVRLLADGTLDPSFLGTGQFTLGGGGVDIRANAVALMPGGRIAIFGRSVDGRSAGGTQTGVFGARLDPDGQLMGSLALALLSDLPTENGEALAVAAQSDGRLLVAGRTLAGAHFVARLLPSTLLVDRSFGVNGYVVSPDFASAANGLVHEPALGRAVLAVGAVPQGSGGVAMQASSPASIVIYQAGPGLQAGTPGTYTVTLVNATGAPVSGFSFGPISVGDPSIVLAATPTTSCPGTVTGAIGSNTISFAGTGAPLADKALCTITVSLVGSSTVSSAWEFPVGSVTSDGGIANLAPSYYAMFVQGGVDTTPDAFSFTPALGVAAGSEVTSGPVTITGITGPAPLSVANGSYSIGCTATYVTTPGTIANGQTVCVRHTAASSAGGAITTTLTVGGVSGSFLSTAVGVQSITFAPVGDSAVGALPTRLFAFASSGLPVVFTSTTPAVCTVGAATATMLAAGTCTIAANQPGGGGFAPAPQVVRSFNVAAALDPNDVVAIAAGGAHTCALTTGGGVKCWGRNFEGALGDGSTTDRLSPMDVTGLGSGVKAIVAGAVHSCALTDGGGVKCWGRNANGQLGDGSTTTRLTPVDVTGLGSGVMAIAAGTFHTCAIAAGGGVKCWGYNSVGQLGDGTFGVNRPVPVDVTGLGGVTSIAAGIEHTCAITAAAGIKCWGANSFGQLGDGSNIGQLEPVDVAGLPSRVMAVTAGTGHTCALLASGGVMCWGRNAEGALGDGSTTNRSAPVDVTGLSGVAAIAAGAEHTCALTASGGVMCWGRNAYGALGDGSTTNRLAPVDVTGLSGVTALATGGSHTCALTASGGIKCWGFNPSGQLGDGTVVSPRPTPVDVVGLSGAAPDTVPDPFAFTNVSGVPVSVIFFNVTVTSNAVTISGITGPAPISVVNGSYAIGCTDPFVSTPGTITNGQSVCVRHRSATTPGGTVTTTLTVGGVSATFTSTTSLRAQTINSAPLGESAVGAPPTRLFAFASSGLPVVFNSTTPAVCTVGASTSATESTATMLSAGTCTITVDQPGGAGFAPAPQLVSSLLVKEAVSVNDIVSIAASVDQTCAVTMSGAVKCWGLVLQPVPGRTDKNAVTPIDVTGLSGPVTMAAPGRTLACARTTSGRVECWGTNSFGELGLGTSGPDSSSLVPVAPIGLSSGVAAVSALSYGACALTTTGGVRCWGENSRGSAGNGTVGPSVTSPVDVLGLTSGVSAISALYINTCALTTGGGVKCWGVNDFGSLGDGTGISSTTPVNVSGLSGGVVAISGSCALTTRGLVKCWGPNDKGQVGDGTLTDRYEPADVVGLASDVAAIAAGGRHTCALTTGGGVKCWGNNEYGQLGDGTQTNRLTPVGVVGLASDVVAIATGLDHTCALMKNGGAKCWGRSLFGRLGIGDSPGSIVPADVVDLDGVNRRPDPFAFQGVSGVPAGSTVTSNLVTISGIEGPSPITVANGSYSIGCTPVFVTTPGTVTNGQTVCVRHAASAFDFTTTTTTVVVGGYSSSFSSQTGARASLTLSPTRLDYASRAVGSASATQVITVTNTGLSPATGLQWGVNADFQVVATTCTASLAVGASCTISITFTPLAPGERADELLVFSTSPVAVVRAVLYGFGVATDVVPNAFAFTDQFVVPMSTTITSAPVQVTGLTGAAPVSVANGSYCVSPTNSCSGCTFRQDPSTITDGQYLCARHTSSPVPGGQVDTLVFVGGLGDAFTSITIDTVPAPFTFAPVSRAPVASAQTSPPAAIVGINAPAPISVTGGQYSIGCSGTWTSTAGTVTNGQTVCVRHSAASGYGASTTTTLNVGGVTGSFVSTTAPATTIPRLGNISTRMQVLTGNDVLIGGFIIGGTKAKTVVVRARGPSLAPFGITNFLVNPQLQLYSGQTVIASNDDWGTATNAVALSATGFAPENAREAAILTTLTPGAYTAIVSGVGGTTGVGIVEVFEVDLPEVPLANISTRGSVLTGNDVMIGGFIIQGDAPQTVIVRARGPSLADFGITNPLANPVLQLFAGQAQIAMNDNWQETPGAAQIQSRGFAPANAFESAILITLNPGAYTAIVTGAGGTTGVGIIEVFAQ